MSESLRKEVIVYKVENLSELSDQEQLLIESARTACENAYAPYSQFSVGAAVCNTDGTVTLGNNQENMAYPSGLCAERVAIFSASSQKPNQIFTAMAVHIKKSIDNDTIASPCGACRQVLYEYEYRQKSAIKLYLSLEGRGTWCTDSVENLLPFPFSLP